jgi:hypothetical protein
MYSVSGQHVGFQPGTRWELRWDFDFQEGPHVTLSVVGQGHSAQIAFRYQARAIDKQISYHARQPTHPKSTNADLSHDH